MANDISWLEKVTGLQYPPDIMQLLVTLTEMESAPPVKFSYGPFSDFFIIMDFKKLRDIRYKTYFHITGEEYDTNPYAVIGQITECFEHAGNESGANFKPNVCLPFAYDEPRLQYLMFTGRKGELVSVHRERLEILLFNTGEMPLFNTAALLENVLVEQSILLEHPKMALFLNAEHYFRHVWDHEVGDIGYHVLMNKMVGAAQNNMRLDYFKGQVDGDKLNCVLEVNGNRAEFSLSASEELDVNIIYYLNDLLNKSGVKKRFCVCKSGNYYMDLIFAFVDADEYASLKTNHFLAQPQLWDK